VSLRDAQALVAEVGDDLQLTAQDTDGPTLLLLTASRLLTANNRKITPASVVILRLFAVTLLPTLPVACSVLSALLTRFRKSGRRSRDAGNNG
jgi:hypothetical protein